MKALRTARLNILGVPTFLADDPWRHRAACAGQWDIWEGTAAEQNLAAHICLTHCPVLVECSDVTHKQPPREAVQAGVVWDTHGRAAQRQPAPRQCGALCAGYLVEGER